MVQILQFLTDEEGAVAAEYALLAALIAAAIIGVVGNLGQIVQQVFTDYIAAV